MRKVLLVRGVVVVFSLKEVVVESICIVVDFNVVVIGSCINVANSELYINSELLISTGSKNKDSNFQDSFLMFYRYQHCIPLALYLTLCLYQKTL